MERPVSLREAHEVVSSTEGPLQILGGATKADWGNPPRRSTPLSTLGLAGVREHDPADMTATVGAGTRLSNLQARLAEAGQWLPLDPPGEMATVGGIFATNDSGPMRHGYGSLRELVIGMTVVLADGTVARSGGRVIKNVAGYDLCRLFCGALGTLGLVVELTLRLHPRPAAERTLIMPTDAEGAQRAAQALLHAPLEPVAVDHDGSRLYVTFHGGEEAVAGQASRAVDLLGPMDTGERDLAAIMAGAKGDTVLRLGVAPDHYARTVALVQRLGDEVRLETRVAAQVGLGLIHVRWRGDAIPPVRALRAALAVHGGYAVVRRRSEAARGIDGFGAPPSGIDVMRRVKRQLDPRARWAPGRYLDW